MKINTNKLKGKIVESGYNYGSFAKAMNVTRPTLYKKLNGKGYFDTREIVQIINILNIPMAEIQTYFFDTDVPCEPTKDVTYGN